MSSIGLKSEHLIIQMNNIKHIFFTIAFVLSVYTSIFSQTNSTFADVPTLNYCDIVRNAATYDKKTVRVKAVYFSAFEGSLFLDSACESQSSWVKFSPLLFEKKSKVFKKFLRLSDASAKKNSSGGITYPERKVSVLVVAIFEGIKPTYKIGKLELSSGFGHMDSFDYQFTVLSVEAVKDVQ